MQIINYNSLPGKVLYKVYVIPSRARQSLKLYCQGHAQSIPLNVR